MDPNFRGIQPGGRPSAPPDGLEQIASRAEATGTRGCRGTGHFTNIPSLPLWSTVQLVIWAVEVSSVWMPSSALSCAVTWSRITAAPCLARTPSGPFCTVRFLMVRPRTTLETLPSPLLAACPDGAQPGSAGRCAAPAGCRGALRARQAPRAREGRWQKRAARAAGRKRLLNFLYVIATLE
jgi:hypothetical protein